MRRERDFIGEVDIESNALYGIHSVRAKANFPDNNVFNENWYVAMGSVKQACYRMAKKYFSEIGVKFKGKELPITVLDEKKLDALISASIEIEEGHCFDHFIVPSVSGGAGTSINLNINEIIANRALQLLGHQPGDYAKVDPIEHANIFQSTNDVVPTALKVATLRLLTKLETSINENRFQIEQLENQYTNTLRIGYTQMQEAVPSSYGRLFSAYNEALSRDWWRVSKCFERIKVVNLGGSAIGTGITVPRYFIMHIVQELQQITGLPVTRGENLADATSNLDAFVEIHATLKAHAVNLEKMTGDLRLLASDINGKKELILPKKQVGSSIMPGKINPVIPEYVISCAHKVYANDQLIASLAAQGCLDLNAYLPIIGDALLNSLELLIGCNKTIKENLIQGLEINAEVAWKKLIMSPSLTTALVPAIGYHTASEIARYMQTNNCSIHDANKSMGIINKDKLDFLISPAQLLKQGFSLKENLE